MKLSAFAFAGLAVAGLLAAAPVEALAQSKKGGGSCVDKGGRGTGSSTSDAQFQAWEAVLQATDWGSWSSFMASGMKIGSAPGYKVANLKHRCVAGGSLGRQCTMQAQLCN